MGTLGPNPNRPPLKKKKKKGQGEESLLETEFNMQVGE